MTISLIKTYHLLFYCRWYQIKIILLLHENKWQNYRKYAIIILYAKLVTFVERKTTIQRAQNEVTSAFHCLMNTLIIKFIEHREYHTNSCKLRQNGPLDANKYGQMLPSGVEFLVPIFVLFLLTFLQFWLFFFFV